MHLWARIASLTLLLFIWGLLANINQSHLLPGPLTVIAKIEGEIKSGAMLTNLMFTLYRVVISFLLSMILGSLIGYLLGRFIKANYFFDSWLLILLNIPALTLIVMAYIWGGLNEVSAITAVVLNKLPNVALTMREGARSMDVATDEMAKSFHIGFFRYFRHIVFPQLAPYFAVAARNGLSLVWKIVLIVELLGRSNGVGFQINIAFQLFDMNLLFAYSLPFAIIMLVTEIIIMQPFEKKINKWRYRHA